MKMNPKIVISTTDFDRLEALVDSLPASEARVKQALLGELSRADIVEASEMPENVVRMNSTVRFRIESTGEESMLTLVYPFEAGKDGKTISILSPVGTALLGMPVGEQIQWNTPGHGNVEVKILAVES